jgi:hypothetical protein
MIFVSDWIKKIVMINKYNGLIVNYFRGLIPRGLLEYMHI